MKKYLCLIAAILTLSFSSFTKPSPLVNKKSFFTTGIYWYLFTGTQTVNSRRASVNYVMPTASEPTCSGFTNECAVRVVVTLDAFGNPPAHPNFTDVTCDANGFPNGGGDFIDNAKKS